MDETTNGNWILGERTMAADGDRFQLRSPGSDGRRLGTWPRSRSAEWLAALDAAEHGSGWSQVPRSERCDRVGRALDLLEDDPDPGDLCARSIGVTPAELAGHLEDLWQRLDGAPARDPLGDVQGGIVVAPHWSELFAGFAEALLALEEGHPVCLLSSAPATAMADRFAECLWAAGVSPGAFSVLHDDGTGALRCAAELADSGRLGALCFSAPSEPSAAHARRAPASIRVQGFGAGVLTVPDTVRRFRQLTKGTAYVGVDEPPGEAAQRVLEAALGRRVLGGQAPGQTGRVLCHPRVFSAFSRALLSRLDAYGSTLEGLFGDPEVARELAQARELGLDEGATLIEECVPGAGLGSPSGTPGASLGWLVFTNVEPTMRLAALTRPAPLLLLMRGKG